MSEEPAGIPDSLRVKFPGLRPVKRAPNLIRVNGIGLGMYGQRDFDAQTRTYVKTHCLCVLFVPLFALGAYRVADAEKGWYFIGKEHLSSFAKSCNIGFLTLSLMFGAIMAEHAYKTSPDYLARQDMARAQAALQAGRGLEAARLYRDVALGATAQAEPARRGLSAALEQSLSSASPDTAEAALRLVAALPRILNSPAPIVAAPYERGLALVEKFRAADPERALGLLRQVSALAGRTNASVRPLEIDLLKAAIAAHPANTNRVVELALLYEEQKQLELSWELLAPYQQKLGATEGARILGQHLLDQGKYEDSYGLLYPYVQARLEKLREVERNYTNTIARVYKRAIEELNAGRGDRSFYDAYDKASKAEKEVLVDRFARKRIESDSGFKRAVADLTAANKIIHVTLDLGMVQLNRAQNLSEPAARKTELEAAERTFLAIHGLAGDTDEYRLFLGQVYFWLGRAKEGQELFDQLLAAHQRDHSLLLQLARTLREVGEEGQARSLTEEAYRAAKADKDKFNAAALRARLHNDIDDQIAWLEKCDPTDPNTQIDLNDARGEKALRDGNRELAARYLRKAIEGYQNLPQNAVLLNNCGLVYLNLYLVTGNIEDHNHGLALLEQALTLSPGNSLLLVNITQLLITRAFMDTVGDAIHFAALKESPDASMLGHLYKDEAGRAQVLQNLRENEHLQKALAYLDKALLLAPKNAGLYGLELHLQGLFHDTAELEKLQQRLRVAAPELAEIKRDTQVNYSRSKDKERLEQLQTELRRYEALLSAPGVQDHPLTREFAEVAYNGLAQGGGLLSGTTTNSQKLLDQALAIHQRLPTSASLGAVIAARFYRAHEQLKEQQPDYANLAEATSHALTPRELLACLLERNHPLAPVIKQNPEVQQALELLKTHGRLFPSLRQPDEWALFRRLDEDETAIVVRQLQNDQAGRRVDDLTFQLNPLSATAVLKQYWTVELNGDPSAATSLYQQALRDGVPLPPL